MTTAPFEIKPAGIACTDFPIKFEPDPRPPFQTSTGWYRLRVGKQGRERFFRPENVQNLTDIRKRWQRRKELRARRTLKQEDIML